MKTKKATTAKVQKIKTTKLQDLMYSATLFVIGNKILSWKQIKCLCDRLLSFKGS
jgi:hypothetical protein